MFSLDCCVKSFIFSFSEILLQRLKIYFLLALFSFSPTILAEITDQQKLELKLLKSSILKLQNTLIRSNEQKVQLEIDFKEIEIKISKIDRNIRILNSKIATTVNNISEKETEQISIKRRIAQQNEIIIQQLRSASQLGHQEPIKLLLNQEDPIKLARMFKYYDYFIRARSHKILEYTRDITDLSGIIDGIKQDKFSLVTSKEKLKIEQQSAELHLKERTQILKRLTNDITEDETRLRNLKIQRAGLQALIDAVSDIASSVEMTNQYRPFQSLKGNLSWPIKGKLINNFGSKRSGSMRWNGWLIKANKGTSVKTVHEGRVVFSDYLRGFGLMLILDHGDGFMTLYGHNQELLKDTGEWVNPKDEIAKAGNTGGLTESALYFEVRHQGQPKNPKIWLTGN